MGSQRSYASPVIFETADFKQVVGISTEEVYGVDQATGEIAWEYPLMDRIMEIKGPDKPRRNIFPNSPVIKDHMIYITSGYDNNSVMLEVSQDGRRWEEKWVDRTLDCHLGGVVEIDGRIFGSNWHSNRDGMWVSLDWETGEVKYLTRWGSKGSIVFADGLLYLYEEKEGQVGLAEPDGEELEIISSFQLDYGEGHHWAHPYIADGKLVIRHGESIGVYNIRSDQSAKTDP
jgi:outer membrane protein assembly factor BamB